MQPFLTAFYKLFVPTAMLLPNSLPHWRSLTIKDEEADATLTIKPHGGIANGWFIDTAETRSRGVFYRSDNSDSESDIPLISDDTKEIQYTISLK